MVPSQKNTPPVSQYTSRRRLIQTGPLKCPASLSRAMPMPSMWQSDLSAEPARAPAPWPRRV